MRICHVTTHLPPDQGANALLPWHLGRWAVEAGDKPSFVAHPPRSLTHPGPEALARVQATLAGPVTWIEPRSAVRVPGLGRLSSLAELLRIQRAARPAIEGADVVHLHSNGLLPEAVSQLAGRAGRPTVLTLYGTEIWHYKPRRLVDLFTRAYRSAAHVTFYSRGLLDKARELGLDRDGLSVAYPPVASYFRRLDETERAAIRKELGVRERFMLVNVKRLHPLAGQIHLIDALPSVLADHPDTRLVVCGAGPLRESLAARAAERGVAANVTFTGLIDNHLVARYQQSADLFVLPSDLEALPTVAIEALASGTPVVSTDNPGGMELQRLFEDDVRIVPRGSPGELGAAISAFLGDVRRTRPRSDHILQEEFAPSSVAARFRAVYLEACSAAAPQVSSPTR